MNNIEAQIWSENFPKTKNFERGNLPNEITFKPVFLVVVGLEFEKIRIKRFGTSEPRPTFNGAYKNKLDPIFVGVI